MRDDLVAAFMLLTRLPVARFGCGEQDLAAAVWAFPLVGMTIGALGGLVYWAASWLGSPPLLSAVWSLAAMLMATGALHEDGLADTVDGFGGGRTLSRKLEIMRDSRIGSYGALALMLSVLVRVGAVAVLTALMTAGLIARAAIILVLILLPAARPDGMGAAVGTHARAAANIGLVLAVAIPLLLLPFFKAVAVLLIAVAACLAFARLAARQIGGYSGDVLGATAVIVECVALTAIVAMAR